MENQSKYALNEMDLSFVLLEIKGQLPFFTKEIINVSNSIKYDMNHVQEDLIQYLELIEPIQVGFLSLNIECDILHLIY